MNLFIDSNIWLSLYHFTNDDLEQFAKLKDMINKSIRLFVPQQVYSEISRNREAKLKEALKFFDGKDVQFPAFSKGHSEFEIVKQTYSSFIEQMKDWKKKINSDILLHNLPADKTIEQIFEQIDFLPCQDYVQKAYNRYRIGNPPGKDNKYGDAINWECLLDKVPYHEDLYFISADKDYCSELFDGEMKDFLKSEWANAKNSKIHFYKNLVSFLNKNVSDIKLEAENRKSDLIEELRDSRSFQETHKIVAQLKLFTGWAEDQIELLCSIAEKNSQVRQILRDSDVFKFYMGILSGKDPESLQNSAERRVLADLYDIGKNRNFDEDLGFTASDTPEDFPCF